jgi:hypothetical protein
MITKLSASELLSTSRTQLGLPPAPTQPVDDAFLAASLRRAAGFLCPCSASSLARTVSEALTKLSPEPEHEQIIERIDAVIETLTVVGDLLELSQVVIDDPDAKQGSLFAAPPSFSVRPDGTAFLIGIASDEVIPLPASLASRVTYQGCSRVLVSQNSEDLGVLLHDLGLIELSASVWLAAPKKATSQDFCESMTRRLSACGPSGTVEELAILDSSRDPSYYPKRWAEPTDHTGNFVARRPQAYGSPLWGFVELTAGKPVKFLDFPLKGFRWRGCDMAWQLQMAIDFLRRSPQTYRLRSAPEGTVMDFFSPIPLWAQRRLTVLGHAAKPEGCLLSFFLPDREVVAEENFLKERLWLHRRDLNSTS